MQRGTVVLAVAAALIAGCNAPEIVTTLDRNFRLGVGRQAVMPTERVEVGFDRVISDSRCAEGATCVWAGESQLAMWLGREGGGDRQAFEVKLPAVAKTDSATAVDVGDYRVNVFRLTPYPKLDVPTDTTAYVVELRVTRR